MIRTPQLRLVLAFMFVACVRASTTALAQKLEDYSERIYNESIQLVLLSAHLILNFRAFPAVCKRGGATREAAQGRWRESAELLMWGAHRQGLSSSAKILFARLRKIAFDVSRASLDLRSLDLT